MKFEATTLGRPHSHRLLPAPNPHYEPGALIAGKYRLEAELGEGGMGTVWRARNEILGAPVALKLIRSGMQCEETVGRLLLEARIEAKLKHPNIVRVFDFGQTQLGDAFIVMEMLDGINLGQLLEERGRLGAIEAVRLVLPVIEALCHAHENGVVHRDLKPDNILLDRSGLHAGTKLLDFGIARLVGNAFHRRFDQAGRLLGSPGFMAPEQARGEVDVDHRADIWALCVVLYEAISGTPAFSGEDREILRKIINDPVPPLEAGVGGPALWCILGRGLEKDRLARFQSMRELGTALAQWLCDRGEREDLDGSRISGRWEVVPLADTAERVTHTPRPHGMNEPTMAALRMAVALVFAVATLLAPSKIGSEPAMSAGTGQVPHAAVAEVALVQLLPVALPALSVENALSTRAVAAPALREPRETSHPRRSNRRLTETDLGLKVPY